MCRYNGNPCFAGEFHLPLRLFPVLEGCDAVRCFCLHAGNDFQRVGGNPKNLLRVTESGKEVLETRAAQTFDESEGQPVFEIAFFHFAVSVESGVTVNACLRNAVPRVSREL